MPSHGLSRNNTTAVEDCAGSYCSMRLAQMQRELDRATDDNIDTNKRLLHQVEELKNVRDNEFNTLAVRRKANEDAYKVEKQREDTLVDLARRRVELLRRQIALDGGWQTVQYHTAYLGIQKSPGRMIGALCYFPENFAFWAT